MRFCAVFYFMFLVARPHKEAFHEELVTGVPQTYLRGIIKAECHSYDCFV